MKKTHHVVDEQEIMRFNMQRENKKGKIFSLREFQDLLKAMGYASSGNLVKCMVSGENPPFIRIERGKYAFNPNPVHIQRLQTVWDMYSYPGRNRQSSNPNQKQIGLDVSRAIKLLKDLGYRILKPVTQYEEC